MTNDNYTKITWPEVRKGDVLMNENGDRLTVENVADHNISTVTGYRSVLTWGDYGFTPYRKQPELPTEPGAYHDKDGDYWLLDRSGNWYDWSLLDKPIHKIDSPRKYAPFTRLVPMPTEEQIEEALLPTLRKVVDGRNWLRRDFTDAVMALLTGDKQEVGS